MRSKFYLNQVIRQPFLGTRCRIKNLSNCLKFQTSETLKDHMLQA